MHPGGRVGRRCLRYREQLPVVSWRPDRCAFRWYQEGQDRKPLERPCVLHFLVGHSGDVPFQVTSVRGRGHLLSRHDRGKLNPGRTHGIERFLLRVPGFHALQPLGATPFSTQDSHSPSVARMACNVSCGCDIEATGRRSHARCRTFASSFAREVENSSPVRPCNGRRYLDAELCNLSVLRFRRDRL